MTESTATDAGTIRTAELVASVCLASDLGMGFPFEHGLQATLMAMELCERLDVDDDTASQTYYASLLTYVGCTADAEKAVDLFGGSLTENVVPYIWGSRREIIAGVVRSLPPPESPATTRIVETVRRLPTAMRSNAEHQRALCEVAETLAARFGLSEPAQKLFVYLSDRWDGKGPLRRASGEEIPLPLRIALLARDAAFQRLIGGDHHATQVISERSGKAFDPQVAAAFLQYAGHVFAAAEVGESAWDLILAREPGPRLLLEGDRLDGALSAIGDFVDLISPSLVGHSASVAALTQAAAAGAGFDEPETHRAFRAALIHDVGRVAVDPRIWEKQVGLDRDETEKVRLHPYHTERILAQSPFLRDLATVGASHHEHLDGSGYHRRIDARSLDRTARLLAAADTFQAMTEPRPHRAPIAPERAAAILGDEANAGRYDPDMVEAVIEAAGEATPALSRVAGLTRREVEIIGLLSRGLQTKQIASVLGVSTKTADTHIQNAYRKIRVSTRAAATLFAMEHGLVASGELPMDRATGDS